MSQAAEVRRKRYPERKAKLYSRVKELASKYPVIAVSSLHKVRARQLAEVRARLRGRVVMLGAKNKLALKALREAGLDGVEELGGYFRRQSLLIFTDMNPFELQSLLEKSKVDMPAKAGDVATSDIVVPSGNTGLQPGPVLSAFKQFKIPTRIESGSIFVTSDTVVAKAGEAISADLASLLSKLGLKPIKSGLSLEAVYWEGRILRGDQLVVRPEEYRQYLEEAHWEALKLAIGVGYPAPEVLPSLLAKAAAEAVALSAGIGYPTEETSALIVSRAEAEARALAEALRAKGVQA